MLNLLILNFKRIFSKMLNNSLREKKLKSTINVVNKIDSLLSIWEKKKIDKKVIIDRLRKISNPSKKAIYTTFVNFILSEFCLVFIFESWY